MRHMSGGTGQVFLSHNSGSMVMYTFWHPVLDYDARDGEISGIRTKLTFKHFKLC